MAKSITFIALIQVREFKTNLEFLRSMFKKIALYGERLDYLFSYL
jgi:hypothetical protein